MAPTLKADGSIDGYWKLLIDFKMYDNDGVGSPQTAVRPEFNMDEARRISDMQKVTSAYAKDNNPVRFVENSNVLYADKKRTTSLLRTIGFQMPIELNESGYVGSISYVG